MRWVILIALACVIPTVSGCSDACLKTAAERGSILVLFEDAHVAVGQAEAAIALMPAGEQKDKAMGYLDACRQGLRAASELMRKVDGACAATDVVAVFKEFVAAWQLLAPFLTLMAGPNAVSRVQDPLVVKMVHP
jgi:hypothetical protein